MKLKVAGCILGIVVISVLLGIAGNRIKVKEAESVEYEETKDDRSSFSFMSSFDPENIQKELKKDVKAPELTEEHLEEWDEEFVNSDKYDPIYHNMRFSVNGVSVHIPYTAADFEELFNTEFVYATDVSDTGKNESIRFYDKNYNFLEVQYNETAEYVDKSDMTLEEKLDLPIQDFQFGSWQDFPQVYPEGHPSTSKDVVDVDKHSLFYIYDVVFENPNEYDSGIIKNAGYGFAIVPAHFLAFREYVAGTLPKDSYADGDTKRFAEYLPDPDDDGYYLLDNDREPLRYTVDDVTCDGIDELCILKDDSVLDIYTYDKKDKCIRKIWTGNTDHNECKIDKGTLMFYYHSPALESQMTEDIKYYVLNTKGDIVFKASVNKSERCVFYSMTNEDECEYEGTYHVDGKSVSRDEYNKACDLYYNPKNYSVFDKFDEPGRNEEPSLELNTSINIYIDHSGYEYTTNWSLKERRKQLGLTGNDAAIDPGSLEGGDVYCELYADEIKRLQSEGKADSYKLIYLDDDDIPELLAFKPDFENAGDVNTMIYTINDGKLTNIFEEFTGMFGCYLEISERNSLIYYMAGDVGTTEMIWKYADGELTLLFEGYRYGYYDDLTEEYIEYCSISGQDVSKEEYYNELFKYLCNPFLMVNDDGLYSEINRMEDGYINSDHSIQSAYSSYEDMMRILNVP